MLEYLLSNLWQLWLLMAVVCLILEVLTGGTLYMISFAFGAVVAGLIAFITDNLNFQIIVWVASSVVSVFCFRPILRNYLHKKEDQKASNTDALIGREGKVSETIDAGGFGRVAIDGDDWKAQSIDGTTIDKGATVVVVSIESIIITVKKL